VPLDEPLVFEGTPVTRENFTEWKHRFDEERRARGDSAALERARSVRSFLFLFFYFAFLGLQASAANSL
jgi:hypothetical protein